jgi:Domain of unknown function (DUF3291)
MRKLRRSLEKATGFLSAKLLADRNGTFWTMSMWEDMDSMRAFRNSGLHRAVMLKAAKWCDQASVVRWETQADELPGWAEGHRRMSESGTLSPLQVPSADYKARRYEQPYLNNHNCLVVQPRK